MPFFLTALSNIKGVSLFFCGYIRLGKSNSRANCCQGCQGIAFILPSSSHRHCHHVVKAKKAKGMMAGKTLQYLYFLYSFPKFLLLSIMGNNCQLVGCLVWSILVSGCRKTFAQKPESSCPKKENSSHSFSLWLGKCVTAETTSSQTPPHNFLSFSMLV